MSRCRKCKGAGEVPDLTWCGDDTCCPRMLECLACAPTAPSAEAIAEALGDALPDVPVYTFNPDLVYELPRPEIHEGQRIEVRDSDGTWVGTVVVGKRIPETAPRDAVERFSVGWEPPS